MVHLAIVSGLIVNFNVSFLFLLAFHKEKDKRELKLSDQEQVARIRKGDTKAFEVLFFEFHEPLSRFAHSITKSREFSRDAVQDVFLKIWRNREEWEIRQSLKVYLYQAVRNQSLNLLEKQKTRLRITGNYQEERQSHAVFDIQEEPDEQLTEEEKSIVLKIWEIVERMPDKRRLVFELHRKHGFSYKEIASILGVTRKTVENHIGQALKQIREELK